MLINQFSELALECGIAIPEGAHKVMDCLPDYLEDAEKELSTISFQLFHEMLLEPQQPKTQMQQLEIEKEILKQRRERVSV
ncbi:hypothetical protein [Pectobacterium odoriferum]|nr:hypothetical protein [Pectobacterium odoriferum]MCA6961776.1 hypothetical protein [Pectobacterium odoriferum]MCH5009880.1 hypothetical protein [Pectobacterium odoriferum]